MAPEGPRGLERAPEGSRGPQWGLLEQITKNKKIMIIIYFFSFFAFFSKTVGLSSVFSAKMNSTCQNTLITAFLWDLEKKADFLQIFGLTIVWRFGGYGPKN